MATKTIMEPERELDKLVAKIIAQRGRIALPYSTDMGAAWKAWEWLEQNHPWQPSAPMLGKALQFDETGYQNIHPSVLLGGTWWEGEFEQLKLKVVARGETYPHAIALAVVEVGKCLQK
jgi:hypothetical protein